MATMVEHTFEPIYDESSRVLILGTMPSPRSREVGFYYGHPRNRFWRIMERLFGYETGELTDNTERRAFLHAEHIALWDVLARCTIDGASDASIKNAQPNDLARITDVAPIKRIFTTGTKATQLYRRFCEAQTGMSPTALPSTSPANAAKSLDQLVAAYQSIVETLKSTV